MLIWKLRIIRKKIKEIFTDTLKEVFPKQPYRILNRYFDPIRRRKIFCIKVYRISATISLTATEIFNRPEYLAGLPYEALDEITKAYKLEIGKPSAYIEEYPILSDEKADKIFKIMLVDHMKIICGTASFFMRDAREIMSSLSIDDAIKIATADYQDRFVAPNEEFVALDKHRLQIMR